jgi:hypothetical protein
MNLLVRYFSLKKIHLFLIVLFGDLFILWLSKSTLINNIVFYNTFSEQLTYDKTMAIFDKVQELSWAIYAFTPIMLFLKISGVSTLIYVGVFFCDLHEQISFNKVFRVVFASEIIFIIAGFVKFLWFSFFSGNYTLYDLNFFYPLSIINFFNRTEVNQMWIFPLQTINIFQVIYIILISYGLNKQGGINWAKSEKVVLISYLPGLLIMIAIYMFIIVDTAL